MNSCNVAISRVELAAGGWFERQLFVETSERRHGEWASNQFEPQQGLSVCQRIRSGCGFTIIRVCNYLIIKGVFRYGLRGWPRMSLRLAILARFNDRNRGSCWASYVCYGRGGSPRHVLAVSWVLLKPCCCACGVVGARPESVGNLWSAPLRPWVLAQRRDGAVHRLSTRPTGLGPVRRTRPQIHRQSP